MDAETKTRVLFVDHESRLSGGEQDLLDLIKALGPRIEAHVALSEGGPLSRALEDVGAEIHLVPMAERMRKLSRDKLARRPWAVVAFAFHVLVYVWALSRLIAKLKPDFVHTNSMKSHLLASVPARSAGIPLVWHVRDILGHGWLRRTFAFLGGHLPIRIVCISNAVKDQFVSTAAEARALVVYNGIELSRFTGETGRAFRGSVGVAEGKPLVGIVGQIARWKGQDTFIRAASVVAEEYPEARFVIVGECLFPENEAEYERSLHSAVEEAGLADKLHFTGWHSDPAEVMGALDVFIHASRLPEPFGRVIVEAMAAGCCVIASRAGAGPELIASGEGSVVEPDNPRLLAEAIGSLLSGDPAALSAAARKGAERFDISRTADRVASLYAELSASE